MRESAGFLLTADRSTTELLRIRRLLQRFIPHPLYWDIFVNTRISILALSGIGIGQNNSVTQGRSNASPIASADIQERVSARVRLHGKLFRESLETTAGNFPIAS